MRNLNYFTKIENKFWEWYHEKHPAINPQSPVIGNYLGEELKIAKDQPEYRVLPAIRIDRNTVLTRWHLSIIQRLILLFTGNIYLEIMNFRQPIQPLYMEVHLSKDLINQKNFKDLEEETVIL